MSYSWDHPDSPVFSRVLRRRRHRHIVLALVLLAVAVVLGYAVVDAPPAPVTPSAAGSAASTPVTAAPVASLAAPPAVRADDNPLPLAAPGKDEQALTGARAEASAGAAQTPSTDIIREPVLEGARASSLATASAGMPTQRSAVSPAPQASAGGPPEASVQAATEVRQALQSWADAWSRRDFAAYTAAYTPTFKGTLGNRNQWLAQRRERIVSRQRIEVVLTDVVIAVEGQRARVDFRQLYASDNWRDDTRRTVDMQKTAEGWRIAGESNR